jgi:hypothetical protein
MNGVSRFTGGRRLGHGASWRVRFKIADCAIVTTTAIGLTAVSLVLAAPASATDPHGTNDPANHTATSASQERDQSVGGSLQRWRRDGVDNVGKVTTDRSVGEPATAAEPDTANPEAWLPGHDKCKRRRGLRSLPLWCTTDPAAGWIGSTTYRAQNNPGNPIGIWIPAAFILPRVAFPYASCCRDLVAKTARSRASERDRSALNDYSAGRVAGDGLIGRRALGQRVCGCDLLVSLL